MRSRLRQNGVAGPEHGPFFGKPGPLHRLYQSGVEVGRFMSDSEVNTGKYMLGVFGMVAVFLWIMDAVLEVLWHGSGSYGIWENLLPLDRPHELFMRTLLVGTLLASGCVVSYMYCRLARSEQQARESENNLLITFRSIGDGVIATDARGRVSRINRVASELTGWTRDQALGRDLREIFNIVSSRTGESCENPVDKVFSTGTVVALAEHTKLISRDGTEYQIADSAAPILDGHREIVGTVLVFRDVSEEYRKEDELRRLRNYLSNIIDSMPSILVGVDPAGHVTQWNMTAAKVTGISAEDARGKILSEVFPRMAVEVDKIKEAIRDRSPRYEQRREIETEKGVLYEDVTIFPLIANGVEGAVIQIDDVTERFNLEQMMIQTEKMMSVGGLAAGMAHEINNPLAAISANIQNIRNRLYKELRKNMEVADKCDLSLDNMRAYLSERDIPKMLDGISESCSRAAHIVSNMLRFSRKSDKRISSCNLSRLIDSTIDLAANDYDLKKEYDFRKISIVKDFCPDLPEVRCEENEIQQVLLNLLKNGAQAMYEKIYSDGGPCFILRLKRDGNMALIEVEDNGPGMGEEVRKRVFEPFFSTKEVGVGTGLGLSVSYFIITDQHNGSMEVHSRPGEWTKFSVRIPIAG